MSKQLAAIRIPRTIQQLRLRRVYKIWNLCSRTPNTSYRAAITFIDLLEILTWTKYSKSNEVLCESFNFVKFCLYTLSYVKFLRATRTTSEILRNLTEKPRFFIEFPWKKIVSDTRYQPLMRSLHRPFHRLSPPPKFRLGGETTTNGGWRSTTTTSGKNVGPPLLGLYKQPM